MWEHPYTDCVCPVSPLGELDSLRYPLSRGWGWSWVWGRPLPLPSGWHPAGTGSDPSWWRQGSGPGWLCSLRVCVFPSPCVGSLAPELGSTDQSGTHVDPLQAEVWAVCLPELHLFPCSAHTRPHVHVPLAPHSPSLCPASTSHHGATLQGPWGLCGVSGYILWELWGRGCCQSARLLLMRHLSKCQPWLLPTSRLCPRPGLPLDRPNPGIEPRSPALQVDSLPSEPPGKPKNTGMGSLSLLQGIFPTQESNRGLLHCRRILYQLSYQGSPNPTSNLVSL